MDEDLLQIMDIVKQVKKYHRNEEIDFKYLTNKVREELGKAYSRKVAFVVNLLGGKFDKEYHVKWR